MELPKIGQESSKYVNGFPCRVEEVRSFGDGRIMVKLEKLGGLFDWKDVK